MKKIVFSIFEADFSREFPRGNLNINSIKSQDSVKDTKKLVKNRGRKTKKWEKQRSKRNDFTILQIEASNIRKVAYSFVVSSDG